MTVCTCEHDIRTCARHPYVFEGPNGAARPRREFSPSKRLRATLSELIAHVAKKDRSL